MLEYSLQPDDARILAQSDLRRAIVDVFIGVNRYGPDVSSVFEGGPVSLLSMLVPTEISESLSALEKVDIVNPALAAVHGRETWFVFVTGRTGHFQDILISSASLGIDTQHYVLYGERDAAILAVGNPASIVNLRDRFAGSAFDSPVALRVKRTLVVHGVRVPTLGEERPSTEDWLALQGIADELVGETPEGFAERAHAANWIIGQAYDPANGLLSAHGVHALVGLQLQGGRAPISDDDLIDNVVSRLRHPAALAGLYSFDESVPFGFLAHLWCSDLTELDAATDALALMRIGEVRSKTTTMVVSSIARHEQDVVGIGPAITVETAKSGAIEDLARELLALVPAELATRCSQLSPPQQLQLLAGLGSIQGSIATGMPATWDGPDARALAEGYARAFVANPSQPQLAATVLACTSTVERVARGVLRTYVWRRFGEDKAEAQKVLRLHSIKTRDLSLGNVVTSLRNIVSLESARTEELEELIARGESFAARRNYWAHGSQRTDETATLEGTQMISDALDLARRLTRFASETTSGDPLKAIAKDFFICHASEDKATVARPLAKMLISRKKSVWIDETEIHVGDSLRQKIDAGLAACRFGIVVLSPAFFTKNWTHAELDALFTLGMADGRPRVLPVWHEVDAAEVAARSPLLAGIAAARTVDGLEAVVANLLSAAAR